MEKKEVALQKINAFNIKYGTETSEENIIMAIHLMNAHGLEHNPAKDQSSRSANDNGVDGWYYDEENATIIIYQSKLTESKPLTLRGLNDLERAADWLSQVFVKGELDKVPVDNHMLYGLYKKLASVKDEVRQIKFVLLSLFNENEIEDYEEIDVLKSRLAKSPLNQFIVQKRNGKTLLSLEQYSFDSSIARSVKTYEINKIEATRISLRNNSSLHLSYVSLYSLVELFRQRGDLLFDKNVRLSLFNTKEAKGRLVHPLFDTLDAICTGKLKAEIFPFYHVGITITASYVDDNSNQFCLESPGVINGCQTISIAHEYLKKLEKQKESGLRLQTIGRFKEIQVIAKVVVGVNEEELKDITNANNRQQPIEDWQLFSNESVHIAIEAALRDKGIFYERQKGKFDSKMKVLEYAKHFYNTNGTYVTVSLLGQIIAIAKGELALAAKPSLIFENKKSHDLIFDKLSYANPSDIVFCINIYRSLSRALKNFLQYPTHLENDYTQSIFNKNVVRIRLFYIGLLYYYQSRKKAGIRNDYHTTLLRIASPNLVSDMESSFYQKVVTKFKSWYLAESGKLAHEVSVKKLSAFTNTLLLDLGIDLNGQVPFTENRIFWDN